MPISVIQRDIKLKCKPTNGWEAYNCLMEAIHNEIGDLQIMIDELSESNVKKQFIKDWHPNAGTVSVHD